MEKELKEFVKFCKNHGIHYNQKTKRWSKDFHMVLDTILDKKKGYYINKFARWELGPYQHKYCLYCGAELRKVPNSGYKFCNVRERVEHHKIKKKREEKGAQLIHWHLKKDSKGYTIKPKRKDMIVQYSLDNTEPLTKKGRTIRTKN